METLGKVLALAVIVALVGGAASAFAADVELRAVRQGREVVVLDREGLAAKMVALVESCSVDSTSYAAPAAAWDRIAASDSFLQVTFATPRRARFVHSGTGSPEPRLIRAILLPLPAGEWPPHVYVRSGSDTLSFTKYDPGALKVVVFERELELRSVEPYRSLVNLP